MANIIKQSFSVNLLIMKILGLYPLEKHSYINAVFAYLIFIMFAILIPVLNILYFLLAEEFDMVTFNYNAEYACETTCVAVKLFALINKRHRIKKCINYFGEPHFSSGTPGQKKILENCVAVCKRNSKIFWIAVAACVISWIASPIFSEGHGYTLPVDIWLPFDIRANLTAFYMVYLYIALDLLYIGGAAAAVDPIIGGLACHASIQLKILKDNLRNLDEYTEEQICDRHEDSYFSQNLYYNILGCRIRDCIKHHNAILGFIREFEKCFSLVVFSQFAAALFSICFCIMQFVVMAERTYYFDFNFFVSMTSICTVMAEIYFYCHYGTMLFEENNSLTDAIYMGKWYKYDAKSKKLLLILMERSRRPVIITAGKLLDVSLNTFTAILKKAYSLCAVLQSYQ